VPPELPEQEIVRGQVLGVIFEAGALEILHGVRLAVLQTFDECDGERVAELRQATPRVPVVEEAPADPVPGLREIEAVLHARPARRPVRWVGGAQRATELPQEHVVRRGVLRVQLEARALEVLDRILPAVGEDLDELVAQRQAVAGDAAVLLPARAETPRDAAPGLGEAARRDRRRPDGRHAAPRRGEEDEEREEACRAGDGVRTHRGTS
jgi:hypothetical protein